MKNTNTHFEKNIERENIFAELFCDSNRTIEEIENFYKFCLHNNAFTNIADYLIYGKNHIKNTESLEELITIFVYNLEYSALFSHSEIGLIKDKLNKLLLMGENNADDSVRLETLHRTLKILSQEKVIIH